MCSECKYGLEPSCYVSYAMICYVVLYNVMLCYVILCYVMSCHVMLWYAMLCYVMLCYIDSPNPTTFLASNLTSTNLILSPFLPNLSHFSTISFVGALL